jgi:hypothetical protein
LGAFPALRAGNRAIRCNSSESAFGTFLRDFRSYPLRAHKRQRQEIARGNFLALF